MSWHLAARICSGLVRVATFIVWILLIGNALPLYSTFKSTPGINDPPYSGTILVSLMTSVMAVRPILHPFEVSQYRLFVHVHMCTLRTNQPRAGHLRLYLDLPHLDPLLDGHRILGPSNRLARPLHCALSIHLCRSLAILDARLHILMQNS